MPFDVRDAKDLAGVVPGAVVEFTLVVGDKSAYATRITIERYQSVEQDPRTARRLARDAADGRSGQQAPRDWRHACRTSR